MNGHPTIAALRATATAPSVASPLPWGVYYDDAMAPVVTDAAGELVAEHVSLASDAAHIVAAVNAAPHLLAEVDALRAQVAAAREAVAHLDDYWHERDQSACRCASNNDALTAARRALGLGGRQCLT